MSSSTVSLSLIHFDDHSTNGQQRHTSAADQMPTLTARISILFPTNFCHVLSFEHSKRHELL